MDYIGYFGWDNPDIFCVLHKNFMPLTDHNFRFCTYVEKHFLEKSENAKIYFSYFKAWSS